MGTEYDAGHEEEVPASAGKRARNMQPPYLDLNAAIVLAQQIYEQAGGLADTALLSRLSGNSSSSSSFSRKLQALRTYKLTTTMVPPVSVSEIGLGIVAPRDERQRLSNLKIAALGPDPFKVAYERYVGKLLPQDEYLANAFQHDLQVPKAVALLWFSSFKAALQAANLLYRRPDGKTQVLEEAETTTPISSEEESPVPTSEPTPIRRPVREFTPEDDQNGHNTRIALSEGRFATIYIPDRITGKDAKRLKGALTGIMSIIESMVDEPDTLG